MFRRALQIACSITLVCSAQASLAARSLESGMHGFVGIEGQLNHGFAAAGLGLGEPASRSERLRTRLQGRADFDQVPAHGHAYFDADFVGVREHALARTQRSFGQLDLNEIYIDFTAQGRRPSVRLGRSHLKFARSTNWSSIVPERSFDTRREMFSNRRGSDGLLLRWPGDVEFTAGVLRNVDDRQGPRRPERLYTKDEFTTFFGRAAFYLGAVETAAMASNARGGGHKLGVDFSYLFGVHWECFGELTLQSVSSLPVASNRELVYAEKDRAAGLIGLRFTSSQDSLAASVEYLHNGGGYTQGQLQQVLVLLGQRAAALPEALVQAGIVQRRYFSASMQKSIWLDRLELSLGALHALDDHGSRLYTTLRWELSDQVSVHALFAHTLGGARSELLVLGSRRSAGVALRLHFPPR